MGIVLIFFVYGCSKHTPTSSFKELIPLFDQTYWFGNMGESDSGEFDTIHLCRCYHTMCSYNGKLWIIAGMLGGWSSTVYSDVLSSTDGGTWYTAATNTTMGAISSHTCVVFNNSMWVIIGSNVYSSTEGITWAVDTSTAPFNVSGHTCVVYNNDMWVMGGAGVWWSPDGITWNTATNAAAYGTRTGHGGVNFNNKLWMIAGNSGQAMNDVWSSSDGANWACAVSNTAFSARENFACFVLNNQIWVIAGYNGNANSYMNDAWVSNDGINWKLKFKGGYFSPRYAPAFCVYNGRGYIDDGEGYSSCGSGCQTLWGIDDTWATLYQGN